MAPFFSGEIRKGTFDSSVLAGSTFTQLTAPNASFQQSFLLGSMFTDSDFSQANFSKATLNGALFDNCNLQGANFTWALLNSTDMANSDLSKTCMVEVEAEGAIFPVAVAGMKARKGNFRNSDFDSCNLTSCDFQDATLAGCSFVGAILEETNLDFADLTEANLSGATLEFEALVNVDLKDTIFGPHEDESLTFSLTSETTESIIDEFTYAFVGNSPYEQDWLEALIGSLGGTLDDADIPWSGQVIVLGREEFDEDFLRDSLANLDSGIRYMTQEDFINWLSKGIEPFYRQGDERIKGHPGLNFIASLPIKSSLPWAWPSLVTGTPTHSGNDLEGFQDEHPIRSLYGYTVKEGTSLAQRRNALRSAIAGGMQLQEIVLHIARVVTLRKRMRKPPQRAIQRWEEDLQWLKSEYYDKQRRTFYWPHL